MADSDYPLLVFPTPSIAERDKRQFIGIKPKRPDVKSQNQRLVPQFSRLEQAMENRRIALQDNSLGIEPEMVLVIKTVGSNERFVNAVKKVRGLEWLGEQMLEDIVPEFGFGDAMAPPKTLDGQLFLVMSDTRALKELQSLRSFWERDPDALFTHGLAPLKQVFEYLHEIRPWDVEERLDDTGLLENWNERASIGQETVLFEAELWYRHSTTRRRLVEKRIAQLVAELGGHIVNKCVIDEISYHAILGCIDITGIKELLALKETRRDIGLLRCDDIMFLRPVGNCAVPFEMDAEESPSVEIPPSVPETDRTPIVALLDGMPLTGHSLLKGRVLVDDPDDFESAYQARERCHGTAMASLICHDDLQKKKKTLPRLLYVRPIMQPRRGFDGIFTEVIPDNLLPVDLVHRAVIRLFDGEGEEPPASPGVRVINLSIGDLGRPFLRDMSSWARLLDWLSWKYGILFIVSAGNHLQPIQLNVPEARFQELDSDSEQKLIISAIAEDTRNRRLLSPAETLNGLSIGATHDDGSISTPDFLVEPVSKGLPSVISAHGPGYRRSIKPEILLPGGRQLLSKYAVPSPGKVVLQPARSKRMSGQRVATPGRAGELNTTCNTCGTSNAAALASREACFFYDLLQSLRDRSENLIPNEFDVVLIKAFIVHGSSWDGMFQVFKQALGEDRDSNTFRAFVGRFLGYGRPNFEKVVSGSDQRVNLVGFGTLDDGKAAEFSLPLPPCLLGVAVKRRLTITLAWLSPINSYHQNYRVAYLWFSSRENFGTKRSCADHNAVRRGTIQHEVFEGKDAMAFEDGDQLIVKVNCRKDAGEIIDPVRFGLVVTLDVPEVSLFPIPIYQEVRERIQIRARPPVGVG